MMLIERLLRAVLYILGIWCISPLIFLQNHTAFEVYKKWTNELKKYGTLTFKNRRDMGAKLNSIVH